MAETAATAGRAIEDVHDPGTQIAIASPTAGVGALPTVSLVAASGLFVVAFAFTAARQEMASAEPLFWLGLLLLFMPIAARLASADASRRERIVLVVLLGIGLYIVKVLSSPTSLGYDEYLHWRTVNDIVQSGHLFRENPLHPVGPFYPGIGILAAALVSLSGLDILSVALLLVAVLRLAFMLLMFLFFERISRSPRVAGIASLLYVANPQFVLFNAQFAYESLALPLVLLVLFALARRLDARAAGRASLTWVILLGLGGVAITHHISAYALAAYLALWTGVALYQAWQKRGQPSAGSSMLIALVASLSWMLYIASMTISYLGGNLLSVMREIVRLISGEALARQLFLDFTGHVPPLWERITGYAAVLLILAGLPFGLRYLWRRQRGNAMAVALAIVTLTYPASLALRLTGHVATASRLLAFVFLALAYVLTVGALKGWVPKLPVGTQTVAITAWVTVIFVGGVILGWPSWQRMPGPYLVVADSRSVEPQGVSDARWAREYLGPYNRIATDRVNAFLMLSHGEQNPVTLLNDKVNTPHLFFAPEFGPEEQAILQQGQIRYLVVDRRLSSGLPLTGIYFELGEEDARKHTAPLDPAWLAKFDRIEQASRILDSGDVVVYDVERLWDVQ